MVEGPRRSRQIFKYFFREDLMKNSSRFKLNLKKFSRTRLGLVHNPRFEQRWDRVSVCQENSSQFELKLGRKSQESSNLSNKKFFRASVSLKHCVTQQSKNFNLHKNVSVFHLETKKLSDQLDRKRSAPPSSTLICLHPCIIAFRPQEAIENRESPHSHREASVCILGPAHTRLLLLFTSSFREHVWIWKP